METPFIVILLTSSRWLTPEVQAFRKSHNLSFVPVAEHFEAAAQGRQDFPLEAALELVAGKPGKRIVPALHPQPGWRWDMVRIEVAPGGTLLFSCDGQHGEYRLPKTTAKKPNQALGMMMTLAVKRKWRNPPSDAADHGTPLTSAMSSGLDSHLLTSISARQTITVGKSVLLASTRKAA